MIHEVEVAPLWLHVRYHLGTLGNFTHFLVTCISKEMEKCAHSMSSKLFISRWKTVDALVIKPTKATVGFLEVQNVTSLTPWHMRIRFELIFSRIDSL